MKTVFRIILIILFSLLTGIIINQLLPGGVGWRTLVYPALFKTGLINSDIVIISADSAIVLLHDESTVFVDVRPPDDYQIDHIPGAQNIPSADLIRGNFAGSDRLNSGQNVLLYDQEGDLEQLELLSSFWSSHQEKKVYILFGGYLLWLQNQYPVEFDG